MIAYIGIGANLGDARANVEDAFARIARIESTTLIKHSSLYRTAPVDSSGDDYINAVACIDTGLGAHALLDTLHDIELAHGRERPYRNAPRTLDLDILLYGEAMIDTEHLQVPHPRLTHRAFVLEPLLELAPDIEIPGHGPAALFRPVVAHQKIEKLG